MLDAPPNPRDPSGVNASQPSGTFAHPAAPERGVYESVTARVLDALERGTAPWRKPWQTVSGSPANALTGRPYRGVNLVLLGLAPYRDHRWLTFRQALDLGGNVRKGERSTEVVFWKPLDVPERDGSEGTRTVPLLRTYRVFNALQCDGLRIPDVGADLRAREERRVPRAESVLREMPDPPRIEKGHCTAWYAPADDLVGIPDIGAFAAADGYYASLFHELAHGTGHPRRLGRPYVAGEVRFGSADYSREELVAELASAFVCAAVGLDNSLVENSAAYLAGWLRALRGDSRAILVASGQAQRAADWIFGRTLSLAE